MYRGHRRGSGGPPGGATPPGGPHGPQGAGSQPLEGLARPPPWAHAPRVGGETLRGAPPCLGGKPSLPGRRPPSRSHLEGSAPLAPSPINRGVRGGLLYTSQGAAPPLPNTSPPPQELGEALPEYCCSTTTMPSCCCWSPLPQPLHPPCWIKAREMSSLRTGVERGGAVHSALGSSVIWITTSTTPSTPFS